MNNTKSTVRPDPKFRPHDDVVPNKNMDKSLDEALKESFPASDPIAVTIEKAKSGDKNR